MSNVMQWPSRPPVHPPGCDCGCQDSRGSLFECWEQMSQFEQMITEIVSKILANKTSTPVPLLGVTDGSDAKPGEVGEFIQYQMVGTFPAAANTQTITAGVLPPGDWSVGASVQVSGVPGQTQTAITYVAFKLVDTTGFSDDLYASFGMGEPAGSGFAEFFAMSINSSIVQANIKTPRVIAFTLSTQMGFTGETSGQYQFHCGARRMR